MVNMLVKKKRPRKKSKLKTAALIMFLVSYAAVISIILLSGRSEEEPAVTFSPNDGPLAEQAEETRVLGENDEEEVDNNLKSEDYMINQITLGGNVGMELSLSSDEGQLRITDVSNELVTDKDKDQTRMILRWRTSQPSSCEISYSKDGGNTSQVIKEKEYSSEHTSVVPSLTPATIYTYSLKCHNNNGDQVNSDKFIVYTGSPNVSLIDVLQNAAQKAFGWAIGK